MRYAIVSDIHANAQAWTAVWTDIRSVGVDEILCLGDMVGYGPRPVETLERVYASVHHFVLGNHDAVLCGKLDADCFNPEARAIIEWTRQHVGERAVAFLGTLPYALEGEGFRCAHADPAAPGGFRYILEPEDAARVWARCAQQLQFIGHSHVPGIFVLGASGTPRPLPPQDFMLEPDKRYIVNVGSVGQPRNGDVRSSYCICDLAEGAVYFRQVPFDIEAFRRDLTASGLSAKPSYFLHVVDASQPTPLRELLDFRPSSVPERAFADDAVKQLQVAVRAARRWRLGAALLIGLLLLALAGLGALVHRRPPAPTRYAAANHAEAGMPPTLGAECLRPLVPAGVVGSDNRLPDWDVTLEDPRRQTVTAEIDAAPAGADDGAPAMSMLRLRSEAPLTATVASLPIPATRGMRFAAGAQIRRESLRAGQLELRLVQQLADGTERLLEHRTLDRLEEAEGWLRVSLTMPRDQGRGGLREDGTVRLVIAGQFEGEVLIRACSLVLKEVH